ncbi:uracil-DNA glycosylase [Janthinobacterium sp. S3M3]|nr:uracil-DNA glycosylase [Janthinobacterium sp. S3T4]MBB5615493.1 uracil-DNA glycosylase [Janthinobacterium sp. S3M3]
MVRYNLRLPNYRLAASTMTVTSVPASITDALALAHVSWRPILLRGLQAVMAADPAYLPALAVDDYLPTQGRLFAAFALPLDQVRQVLVGEGPYPRAESATGVCFMDGAVGSLWSATGLSKPVNRATSLRNFMKMLLVADGQLQAGATSGAAMAPVAAAALLPGSGMIQTLPDLQHKLTAQGFLLLNAALVFRSHVPPVQDARGWLPFLQVVLEALAGQAGVALPQLVLWGKIAEQVRRLPVAARLPQIAAEHPYNLSFIDNSDMQALFGPMQLLRKSEDYANS